MHGHLLLTAVRLLAPVALLATLLVTTAMALPPVAAEGNEAPGNPAAFRTLAAGGSHVCAILANGRCGAGAQHLRRARPRRHHEQRRRARGWAPTCLPSRSAPAAPPPPSPLGRATPVHCSTTQPSSAGAQHRGPARPRRHPPPRRRRRRDGQQPPPPSTSAPAAPPSRRGRRQLHLRGPRQRHAEVLGRQRRGTARPRRHRRPRRRCRRDGQQPPAVNLGTGRSAKAISGGGGHTRALLDDSSGWCWGTNFQGELGLGDTNHRGDGAGEMGNNLPP